MKILLALTTAFALCSCQTAPPPAAACCGSGKSCCKGSACKDGKCATCKGCGKPMSACACKKH